MKKYLVIGNPISHSLSPKVHNYWFNENMIDASYQKKEASYDQLKNIIEMLRNKRLDGANITVPFKERIIPFLDKLSDEAKEANSVNTIYLSENIVVGHNTDISGFYNSIKSRNLEFKNKKALILGSGGVTPSIIIGLRKLGISEVTISNRTIEKAIMLKKRFSHIKVLEWGGTTDANIIINSTSLGLKKTDEIKLDKSYFRTDNIFYDVIYNPEETNFLKNAKEHGCITQNGLMMFLLQAAESFKVWHKIEPIVNKNLINFLKND
tara:strand:- start:146 stop:943 length:798 start_codon:yes stop_codon:yes gene_type:complete